MCTRDFIGSTSARQTNIRPLDKHCQVLFPPVSQTSPRRAQLLPANRNLISTWSESRLTHFRRAYLERQRGRERERDSLSFALQCFCLLVLLPLASHFVVSFKHIFLRGGALRVFFPAFLSGSEECWKRECRNVGDAGQRKMKWTRSNVSELNRITIVLNRRYNLRSSRLRNWGTGEGSAELFSLLNYFLANHGIPARCEIGRIRSIHSEKARARSVRRNHDHPRTFANFRNNSLLLLSFSLPRRIHLTAIILRVDPSTCPRRDHESSFVGLSVRRGSHRWRNSAGDAYHAISGHSGPVTLVMAVSWGSTMTFEVLLGPRWSEFIGILLESSLRDFYIAIFRETANCDFCDRPSRSMQNEHSLNLAATRWNFQGMDLPWQSLYAFDLDLDLHKICPLLFRLFRFFYPRIDAKEIELNRTVPQNCLI